MLGTLKQRFSLKRCFLLPKCFPNFNVAYKCCYFPQTLFSGQNIAKQCCKPPLNVIVLLLELHLAPAHSQWPLDLVQSISQACHQLRALEPLTASLERRLRLHSKRHQLQAQLLQCVLPILELGLLGPGLNNEALVCHP
jgi:hypothetical protein